MSVTTETTTTQPVPTTMSSTSYDGLIARLDLPSKVRLLTGASMFTLAPEASVDLAEVRLSDGPTGVRGLKFSGGRTVALLPNATLLASTWNEDALAEVGRPVAEAGLAQQIHVLLGPAVNWHRPLLGRRPLQASSLHPPVTARLP